MAENLAWDAARGLVSAQIGWTGGNHNLDIADGKIDLWEGGVTYPFPMAAKSLRISSSDPQDTLGGSGAWMVRVMGVGTDWKRKEVDVFLSGSTPVPVQDLTKGIDDQWLRVNFVLVLLCGSGGTNAGTITVTDTADPAVTYGVIKPSNARSFNLIFSVPKGYRAYLTKFVFNLGVGKRAMFRLERRHNPSFSVTPNLPFLPEFAAELTGDGRLIERDFSGIPFVANAGQDVKLSCESHDDDNEVWAWADGFIVLEDPSLYAS
jgi:hypothetical protein